jgi:hypothetical protein
MSGADGDIETESYESAKLLSLTSEISVALLDLAVGPLLKRANLNANTLTS